MHLCEREYANRFPILADLKDLKLELVLFECGAFNDGASI